MVESTFEEGDMLTLRGELGGTRGGPGRIALRSRQAAPCAVDVCARVRASSGTAPPTTPAASAARPQAAPEREIASAVGGGLREGLDQAGRPRQGGPGGAS